MRLKVGAVLKKNTPNGQAGTEYKIGHGRKKEGVSQQRSDKSSAK